MGSITYKVIRVADGKEIRHGLSEGAAGLLAFQLTSSGAGLHLSMREEDMNLPLEYEDVM